ncbi:selenide, water dikinase SelD [Pseudoponticoccus marisrubri]|uniref:Selenide, water dikinase n=1 Tax=Pseudoponticoccus marisrubri TaxID=1685382 RepID=A0A0W7WQM6_9RHOB|nr:selenide, water dikinase SelD [Pseudoponticoccus marisrubri]KUF12823.1 selenide, water dikinase [Pseudoponticoccus marisrubri]
MQAQNLPLTRDLVLIGGGHTHALVLRKWLMSPLPGARVTVINPDPVAAYSGMLPGYLAGHYSREMLDIDLVRLCQAAGAICVIGAAEALDLTRREIHVPGRPPIRFDVASIDIGITSAMPDLPGFASFGVPAKPLGPFAEAWSAFLARGEDANVVILGGGVAGAEISMALAHAMRRNGLRGQVHLIDRSKILSDMASPARHRVREALDDLAIQIHEDATVTSVEEDGVTLDGGARITAGFVCGAAGARPHGWLAETGLDLTEGFVTVGPTLQTSDPAVFSVGDCAHMRHAPRPKAGVYAVRQAETLYHNLRQALSGRGTSKNYRPQADYLKLVSLGEKAALGTRFGLAFSGQWVWRWKDRIDQAFMDKFRDLPQMALPDLPAEHAAGVKEALGPKPMCGGCGAKLGQSALGPALAGLPSERADIPGRPGDDAALLLTGGARQVISTDHLRAFLPDPVLMARITAVHALGDIHAMAATPQAALAHVILPRMSRDLTERTLNDIMQAARAVFDAAGAPIVGGHSSFGAEMTLGFTVTGLSAADPIGLTGARPGDALILTKPLGSGVIMAGLMSGAAKGQWVTEALEHMQRDQSDAARILADAHAMTDVTGFGLAGHLMNICAASGTGARLALDAIPLMEGALDLSARGTRSTLYPENRRILPDLPQDPRSDLLFDPQTAGGLLAAVPGDPAPRLAALQAAGHVAAHIGQITGEPGQIVTE